MKIQQILIQPGESKVTVIYADAAGNRNHLILDRTSLPEAANLLHACEQHLPSDVENPNKDTIQRDILALEKRLAILKQAIGTT
jgi:hypothetical protein